ncbi:MAG: DNA polymerase III subunit alpha, partial [Actinomycetota bacterium]
GYALIAYQTAWLKAHYPVEYMAALLTSVKDNQDRLPCYLAECRTLGIKVLPPNLNSSGLNFTPRGEQILFGLSAIRNVGEGAAERIIEARRKKGDYESFSDYCRKADAACLNKKVVESLAKAGAFDELGVQREALLAPDPKNPAALCISEQAYRMIEAVLGERRAEDAGQFSLFAGQKAPGTGAEHVHTFQPSLGGVEIGKHDLLRAEKEMLGFYVSEHPLAGIEAALRFQSDCEILDLSDAPDGSVKTVGGILTRMTRKLTKKGEVWFNGVLEDMKTGVEINFWPRLVQETPAELLDNDTIVLIKGRVDVRDDHVTLAANKVWRPDLSEGVSPLRIKMPAVDCTPDRIEKLKVVLASHPGPSPVLLHLATSKSNGTVLRLGGGIGVEQRSGLFAEIRSVLPGILVE